MGSGEPELPRSLSLRRAPSDPDARARQLSGRVRDEGDVSRRATRKAISKPSPTSTTKSSRPSGRSWTGSRCRRRTTVSPPSTTAPAAQKFIAKAVEIPPKRGRLGGVVNGLIRRFRKYAETAGLRAASLRRKTLRKLARGSRPGGVKMTPLDYRSLLRLELANLC